MTINYTSLLGLAKPVTGTESNTWGSVVNDQITSLLEDAVANTASIDVSAANVTLSDTDGIADQARCAILLISGTPGTTRNIVAPSRSKTYIVINDSDSSVVVKGSATTGVTVVSNDKALIAWDGSDFVRVGASAGGSNTQIQYNNNGNLSGSSNLTFDGTTLTAAQIKDSALTSGRVVFSTTGGQLADSTGLIYNSATGALASVYYTGTLKAYSEAITTATVSTSTYNLDLSLSNTFDITLGNNVTFTFTNPPASGTAISATIILRQDGTGSRTATFTNANYSDGLAPTLSTGAGEVDVLTFFTLNGGSFWFGTFAMANVS